MRRDWPAPAAPDSTVARCASGWSTGCAPRGKFNEQVLAAMAAVPRHEFVDTALAAQAYEDTALPIGHGQTISKPSVVAHMLGLLMASPALHVSAARWAACWRSARAAATRPRSLRMLARQVTSIERLQGLA